MGIGLPPRGYGGRGMTLTTHLHLAPKLRMSGAMPLLPLYAFVTWTVNTLPFLLPLSADIR